MAPTGQVFFLNTSNGEVTFENPVPPPPPPRAHKANGSDAEPPVVKVRRGAQECSGWAQQPIQLDHLTTKKTLAYPLLSPSPPPPLF